MDYDVKLIVGKDREIMASHQVMSNASPVFRKMFLPDRFAEGHGVRAGACFELPLPDDNIEAMEILCNIWHYRTQLFRDKQMTPQLLADLATLVDKYDCAHTIQPWPVIWINQKLIQEDLKRQKDMAISEIGNWIHISCHLGYGEQFTIFTSALIERAEASDFSEGPLLLHFQKLSLDLQGIPT